MTSLLTNSMAASTLQQMAQTQRDLTSAQREASSGLRVASASDNAAYWSIGSIMSSQTGALSAVKDGLALSGSIASVANSALKTIIGQFDTIKNDLVSAQQTGISRAAIDLDIKAAQQQIITIANSASFNGQNWLVAQETTNETISDTANFNDTFANVQSVRNKTNSATASFTVTVASTGTYSRLDPQTGPQTKTTTTTQNDTYTDTVATVTPSGQPSYVTKTLTQSSVVSAPTSSGNLTPVDNDIRLAQSYGPSSGLDVAVVSDAPILLFTNNSGQVRETNVSTYSDRTVDENLASSGSSEILLSTSNAASYNTNGASTGLLDQTVSVSNAVGGSKTSLLNMSVVGASDGDLATMLKATDDAITALTGAAAHVGGLMTRIDSQTTFLSALSDALTTGVGSLTDADMNTTATRLQAIQAQQQLQLQSLNIANQNTQIILKLFA